MVKWGLIPHKFLYWMWGGGEIIFKKIAAKLWHAKLPPY